MSRKPDLSTTPAEVSLKLSACRRGQRLKIIAVEAGKGARTHLSQLGLHVGDTVILKRRSIFKGPIIVTSGGTDIAIGYGLAQRIAVEPI